MSPENIGIIIRAKRKQENMTLEALAEKTGLSVSYISMLERGMNSPTLANLQTICKALNITIYDLLQKLDASNPVVKKKDRKTIFNSNGFLYESMTEGKHQLSCIVMTITDNQPHASSPHIADEIGFVISGTLIMNLDGIEYTLEAGDSIYINANTEHSYRKISDEPSESIWFSQSASPNTSIENMHGKNLLY